jgi:hypothetical protein
VLATLAGILLALVLSRSPETAGGPPASPSPSVPETADPSESPVASPNSSEAPSEEPSATEEPTPVVEAPEGVLPPGSIARVVVDSVRVRAEPSTSADEVGTLARDELVGLGFSYLIGDWGPVEADGYSWYPILALGTKDVPPVTEPIDRSETSGWVAAGDGSDAFLELVPPRCVAGDPDLALLEVLLPWEQLACYGNRSITIEGTYGCGGCGGLYPGIFEPNWLASPLNFDLLSVDPNERIGPFLARFAPEGPERPEPASIVRVIGHFDDTAAVGCTVAPGEPSEAIDGVVAELYCREHFVVESYEILGVDEDFPFG